LIGFAYFLCSFILYLCSTILTPLSFYPYSLQIPIFAAHKIHTSMSISVLAQNLRGSEIIKIAGEINELKRQGQNIANLPSAILIPIFTPSS